MSTPPTHPPPQGWTQADWQRAGEQELERCCGCYVLLVIAQLGKLPTRGWTLARRQSADDVYLLTLDADQAVEAYISTNGGSSGYLCWKKGKLHREGDLPALECFAAPDLRCMYSVYARDGHYYRDSGRACVYSGWDLSPQSWSRGRCPDWFDRAVRERQRMAGHGCFAYDKTEGTWIAVEDSDRAPDMPEASLPACLAVCCNAER